MKSLIGNACSKALVNGLCTADIKMCRGVRQGCPLSPLLFVLSTQPLMDFFRAGIGDGRILGTRISQSLTICVRLFADDLGLFIPVTAEAFDVTRSAINCYECGTGAKLNLSKSVVIPLALEEIPSWLTNTGCLISTEGEVQRYLGAPSGYGLSEAQLHGFCLDRINFDFFHSLDVCC